ncbi:hydrogenase expression/formation protein HypE [Kosakonia radicincitans]|uniref:Hydrogenase expression/formation protein HypE n=1 Tax=Kosakonia radicincitans TaxID=283686 RepID=A0AAX2EQD4_9ENTR|nr:hydrogenase expression/formation protein HypE [Kosakonia radicincitans]MDP9565964.1 hydrogenase expression/formation protein HypE [Kosakonia oryzae]KDE33378.1 carbamoyl dehydratase HypE [Kosakonia radicincitans UMEnt01/12]QEM90165.1 hydrogenase expression/formation protein HypE [Kosakonia radicincitans]SFE19548.1 hydrogenase expression/formation protein HypE [Kosakonia radicincitans]SFR07621.1 hydrogenase expression/formation protein HypE [Kosakonia radicincitans]
MNEVQLAHGSGGQAMQQLISQLFMEAFANPWLAEQEDQARLDLAALAASGDRLAFSTDSYVIDPLFFPGGNIGKLAVCGTANDIAVSGATPRYLSCGFILEEGLPMATLKTVVDSMAATARAADIAIVTGDTKVVQRGAADKLFINTAGIGAIPRSIRWAAQSLQPGDVLLASGTLGDHGATILNLREGLGLDGELSSDCAVLTPLIATLHDLPGVKALRDATRGGVNAVVHEFAAACGFGVELNEAALPVKPAVRGVCELLGLEALNFANEGKLVIAVQREAAEQALSRLRAHPLGADAAIIGEVVERQGVRLAGLYGVKRLLDLPHAEPLPRIC